ncbi:hypothetical protein [Mesorhizobium sp. M0955]|uniref:hypothetical protein n=1 Tax=Mesorhizobium sp. M0955 TaxID=2957033 RepID=UPI00333AF135
MPSISRLPVLTDGPSHAVVIVDAERRILGLITQTDLLAAAAARAHGRHNAGGRIKSDPDCSIRNPMGHQEYRDGEK